MGVSVGHAWVDFLALGIWDGSVGAVLGRFSWVSACSKPWHQVLSKLWLGEFGDWVVSGDFVISLASTSDSSPESKSIDSQSLTFSIVEGASLFSFPFVLPASGEDSTDKGDVDLGSF